MKYVLFVLAWLLYGPLSIVGGIVDYISIEQNARNGATLPVRLATYVAFVLAMPFAAISAFIVFVLHVNLSQNLNLGRS